MKKKFTIYDFTTKSKADSNKIPDLEREAHTRNGLTLKVFSDLNHDNLSARAGLTELKEYIHSHSLDVLLVYSLNRLAFSVSELVEVCSFLKKHGVDLISVEEGIDTTSSTQNHFWMWMDSIQAIQKSHFTRRGIKGQRIAKQKGIKIGRPGLNDKTLNLAIKYIDQQIDSPEDALQPWQVQKKCGISSASFYGIRQIIYSLRQGLPFEEIVNEVSLGDGTVKRMCKIYSAPKNMEVPELN